VRWLASWVLALGLGCAAEPSRGGEGAGGAPDRPARAVDAGQTPADATAARDASAPRTPPAPPAGFDDALRLPEANDEEPAAGVLDVTLHARVAQLVVRAPGEAELWTYDGASPGPLLRARVGDRLIVRLHNGLPEPTTIHWHGLEVPAAMDGVLVAQTPIAPGETFTYTFTLPHAGLYWYHPHVHSAEQVFRGLYGAVLVEDPDEPFFGHEVVLVLHDIDLEADGSLGDPRSNGNLGDYFGREGGVVLVNGRIEPTLRARPGEPLRLRLLNAASSRHFRLAVEGHVLHRIGGDNGLLEHTQSAPELLLVPGERADVVLVPEGEVGDTLVLRDLGHDRLGCGGACALDARDLMRVVLEGPKAPRPWPAPEVDAQIEVLEPGNTEPERIELGEADGVAGADAGMARLTINDVVYDDEHANEPLLQARVGETRSYLIVNATDYDHPFHLHGFRFQVLDRAGTRPDVREWKDTMFLPAHGKARIAVRFDDRPGDWMFHCHILDHAELGMMGVLRVLPAN